MSMKEQDHKDQPSLLQSLDPSENKVENSNPINSNKRPSKLQPILFTVLSIAAFVILFVVHLSDKTDHYWVRPIKVEIPWTKDKQIVMEMGTARVLEILFFSGKDDRNSESFAPVTLKDVKWTTEPSQIISVDQYGRVETLKVGKCKLRVESLANPGVFDERTVRVVSQRQDIDRVSKRVINYSGGPPIAPYSDILQKWVERFSQTAIQSVSAAPQSVKSAALNPSSPNLQTKFSYQGFDWEIKKFVDGSDNYYVLRTDTNNNASQRDKYQYFMGDRYLPEDGKSPVMIETDSFKGAWVVSKGGNVTHIIMKYFGYEEKANIMSQQTEDFVMRHGLASEASWNGQKWQPGISDNDGLWTSMYGAGELMKYASLKRAGRKAEIIKDARQSALRSLKACLLISNVSGRKGKVQAKIRHLNNTRIGEGAFFVPEFLKQGKTNSVVNYPGRPDNGVNFYGNDAGKNEMPGTYRYSFLPVNQSDWTTDMSIGWAKSNRNLQGFISRTFVVPAVDPPVPSGGLFFKRNANGTQTVLSDASTLYDFNKTDHPILDIGDQDIPNVLKSILIENGTVYNKSDLVYKGDTSTDQVIGHLFIYKVAYDILDENDQQQKQLKDLISSTLNRFCQHLINNGYTMVDATGQPTKWAKLNRQIFTSDYTIQDATLKAIELLLSFKVAYYVTGQRKWLQEYQFLAENENFGYLDFIGKLYDRWKWVYTNQSDGKILKLDYSLSPSETQIERHTLYRNHFSDEQQAFLAYYLAFQLEQNTTKLEKYRKGMAGYLHSVSKSQNPLWYYIWQLSKPQESGSKDGFGQDILDVASWQLGRTVIDCTKYQAFFTGARPDVVIEGVFSVDPKKVIGRRTSKSDMQFVNIPSNKKVFPAFEPASIYEIKVLPADERRIHKFNGGTFDHLQGDHVPNTIEAATIYTLPYWLGVYHEMLQLDQLSP